jgi:hypothetical protein
MNPSLLAVGIVVPGAQSVSVCPVSSESAATKNVKQSLTASSDSPFLSDSSQPTQFDKVLAVAELHSSDDALSGEGPLAVSQENQDEPELATEDCNLLAVPATDLAQLVTPIASPVVPLPSCESEKGGEAAKIDPDESVSTPQGELQPQNTAPLISVLPDSELSLVTLSAAGSNITEPFGPIPLVAQSGDESFSISSNKSVTGDVTANIPPSQLVTNTEQIVDESVETTNLSGKTPIGKAHLTVGENLPETEGSDAALVSARPPAQPWPGLPGHSAELSRSPGEDTAKPVLSRPVPSTVEGVEGMAVPPEKAPVPDELAVSNGQKMTQLDPLALPAIANAQTVSANPEESAFIARKPIDNKTAVGHKTSILSESADSGGEKSVSNIVSDSVSQKLGAAGIQVSAHQTKDPNASVSEVNPNLQQILPDNNAQILSQRSSASQISNAANTAYPGDLSLDIRKQILESIHSSLSGGDRQISIRLNPPELGKVFIRFQEHNAQITGLLEVSQAQTRYQIEQMLPQIVRDLQGSGIQIKHLEVVLTEQTDHHASQGQSLLDGWSGQHGSSESGASGSNKSADVWLTNDDGCQDGLLRQVQITDDSINILV